VKDPYVHFAIFFIGVGVVAYIATILADFLKAYIGLSMLVGA